MADDDLLAQLQAIQAAQQILMAAIADHQSALAGALRADFQRLAGATGIKIEPMTREYLRLLVRHLDRDPDAPFVGLAKRATPEELRSAFRVVAPAKTPDAAD